MKRRFFAGLAFFLIVGAATLIVLTVANRAPIGVAGVLAAG